MNSSTTIRTVLNEFMEQERLNLTQFAQRSRINAGTLSSILNGNRTLSIDQLDLITEAMGLTRGYFYDQYYEEVLTDSTPDWRRIRPFIYGCEEVGNLSGLQKAVQLLLDNLMYAPFLFEVAEDFYNNGKKEAAIILYENVALSEKSQHSERLALCQYRLFMCKLGEDQSKNYQAALQFELFIDRLNEYEQLEALKDLANTYRSLRRWDKVEEISVKLKRKAHFLYQANAKYIHDQKPTTPLFTYIAYSNLLIGNVYDSRGDYVNALQYIKLYENLDWVKEEDEETQTWKEKFRAWAKMNTMVTRLSAGDTSVLPDYITYIGSNADEDLLSLLNIIEAANRNNFNVDDILQRFEISSFSKQNYSNSIYTHQTIEERLTRLYYELAAYYLNNYQYANGFHYLINSLEISVLINEKSCIIKSVGLFESFREICDQETVSAYQKILVEVYKNEEKICSAPIG